MENRKEVDNLLQVSEDNKTREASKAKGGFNFLCKPWTLPEIVTTCVMFYLMFGWVSLAEYGI